MIIYTDGSCRGNGKAFNEGGFGVVILNDSENYMGSYSEHCSNTTNNREEFKGILFAIELFLLLKLKTSEKLIIYSDSSYAINTFNDWMYRWANNGWIKSDKKIPENLDLVQRGYSLLNKHKDLINLNHVTGHSASKWNELADKLATGKITNIEAREIYG